MTAKTLRHALFAACLVHGFCLCLLAADDPLVSRFADPPPEARILKIIHSWPDDPPAQDELIRRLTQQGFGGVVCNVSFQDYLESDAKWQALAAGRGPSQEGRLGALALRRAGLSLGQGRRDRAARASGLGSQRPPHRRRGRPAGEVVSLVLPPGELFLALAFPVAGNQIQHSGQLDLAGQVRDGRLQWQPTAGSGRGTFWWSRETVSSRGRIARRILSDRLAYPNLLMPEPTRRFLEVTHERYASRLGADLGKVFMATFTDEPSLMSLFMKPMPYRVLPWSPGLPAEFQSRRGYALEPVVPDLFLDAGAEGQKHRYDFWLTISELVSENYFGQIQDWCHRHDLRSGGHLLMEESLTAHVPLYGDFLRCARRLDAPSIDCLTSLPPEVPWYIARLLASAAELEGKTVVMCETSDFTSSATGRPATRGRFVTSPRRRSAAPATGSSSAE